MRKMCLIAAVSIVFAATTSKAITIYDEGIDGDAESHQDGSPPDFTNLGILSLAAEPNIILGNLDGGGGGVSGPDEYDNYGFTTTVPWTMNLVAKSGVDLLALIRDENFSTVLSSVVTLTGPTTNIFGAFAPGTYTVEFLPTANIGAGSYEIAIIPEPSIALLLGLGLVGLSARTRMS